MDKLRHFIQWFVTITTGTLAACAVTTSASGAETVPTAMLWQPLLTSALCALSTVLFFPSEGASKTRAIVGIALHFISLCIIMVYCGIQFGWIKWALGDVASMVGCVVLVYAFTVGVSYALEKKQVDVMNRHLREKYQNDAE